MTPPVGDKDAGSTPPTLRGVFSSRAAYPFMQGVVDGFGAEVARQRKQHAARG